MYRLTENSTIVRQADGAYIPADPGNADYMAYLAWMQSGGEPDPVPLDALRASKWVEIKRSRDAAEYAPLVTPYGTFDADPRGRANLTDSILLLQSLAAMGQPAQIDFTLADNSAATVTLAQIVQVGVLLGQQVQTAYNIGRQLRGQIDAATTPEEIAAIHWPAAE